VVEYGIVHPALHEELEPAAAVTLSMKKAACAVADEIYSGLRAWLEAAGTDTRVRIPDAGVPDCWGAPIELPPPAHPASNVRARHTGRKSRRFIVHPSYVTINGVSTEKRGACGDIASSVTTRSRPRGGLF
jgi:hypothetical protein